MNASALAWRTIRDAASAPYARDGRFALHFARGKLRWDPVFRHLLGSGLVAPRTRVLDIGCGQGLLASLLAAAGSCAHRGGWPADWAEAPTGARVTGIEVVPRDVARARAALGAEADIVCGDMRHTAFPDADTIVLLDVLHYVSVAEQDEILARARSALADGGRLLLRVGDAASRHGFATSQWVDRMVAFVRGRRTPPRAGRTLGEWRAHLAALGFQVTSEPMHGGTPFANVLLVAVVAAKEPRQ